MLALLWACLTTLKVAITALLIGLCLGVLLGLAMHHHQRPLWRFMAQGLSIFLRGIPELLLLFLLYYGLSALLQSLFPQTPGLSSFWAGALGLGLIFSGYAGQIIGAALNSIPKGQFESAQAMGLNRYQCLYCVIFPQIWQHALPGLGNLWQVLLKDTALVSVLGLSEMMQWAKFESTITHAPFTAFMSVSLIYFAFSTLSEWALSYYQHRKAKRQQWRAEHV